MRARVKFHARSRPTISSSANISCSEKGSGRIPCFGSFDLFGLLTLTDYPLGRAIQKLCSRIFAAHTREEAQDECRHRSSFLRILRFFAAAGLFDPLKS